MKNFLIFIFVLCLNNGAFSQPSVRFKRLYDLPPHFTSESQGVIATDSGYIVSGITVDTSGGFGYNKLTIMAVDSVGDSLWVKNYGNPNYQYAHDYSPKWMIRKGNNLFLTCPVKKPSNIWVSVLIKFDMNGDTIWQKEYSGVEQYIILDGINPTPDGGFITSGWIADTTSQSLLLLKTDSVGNEQWRKKINTNTFYIIGQQVVHDPVSDRYIIVGSHSPSATSETQSLVIVTDSVGNKLSQFTYNSVNGGGLSDIIRSSDNNFIACGRNYTGLMIGSWQKMRSQLVKFNISGSVIWQKEFGVPSIINYFSSLIELPDDQLIAAGQYDTIYNYGLGLNTDFEIQKTTSLGDSIWSRQVTIHGMNYQDVFTGFDTTSDGGYILTGYFPVGPSPGKYCLVKLDSFGCDSIDCQLVGINEQESFSETEIYPNPFTNELIISGDNYYENVTILLYNTLGQQIYSETRSFDQETKLSIPNLTPGIYLITLKNESGLLFSQKLIKADVK